MGSTGNLKIDENHCKQKQKKLILFMGATGKREITVSLFLTSYGINNSGVNR